METRHPHQLLSSGPRLLEPIRGARRCPQVAEHGVCILDTARTCRSEQIVDEATPDVRKTFFLATMIRPTNFRAREAVAAGEKSVKRVTTELLDP
jgi:diketogulonate reductase-like aldo/keto reductase